MPLAIGLYTVVEDVHHPDYYFAAVSITYRHREKREGYRPRSLHRIGDKDRACGPSLIYAAVVVRGILSEDGAAVGGRAGNEQEKDRRRFSI